MPKEKDKGTTNNEKDKDEILFKPIPLNKKDERREAKRKYEKGRRDRISVLIDELRLSLDLDDLSQTSKEELTREEILKRAKQTIINLKTKKQELKSKLDILKQN